MLRPMRRSPLTRITAYCLLVTVPWIFGPGQAAEAAGRIAREAAAREAGTARRLSAHEARVIRGRATWPGETRPWQYGVPALGGYGEINCISGNLHIAIPVLGYSGKGVPTAFSLHFNSAATVQSFMPMARPPVSNGWTHTTTSSWKVPARPASP